jgi:hypothetical protein
MINIIQPTSIEITKNLNNGNTTVFVSVKFEINMGKATGVYDKEVIQELFYALRDDWDETIRRIGKLDNA